MFDSIRRSDRVWLCVCLLGVASTVGCSRGPDLPKTYPLRGKVLFKGGAPVTGGSISFESATGEPPWRAGGAIGPDGTFSEVSTLGPHGQELKGIVAGENRVKVDLGRGGEDAPKIAVPRRYLDFEKSGLTVQIPAPRDEVSIELDTK